MKLLITILFASIAISTSAGTGGINSLFGFGNNGGVDAGTGGIVGGVDEVKDLQNMDWNTIRKHVKQDQKLDLHGDIAYVGRIVSVFDVCLNNDTVETISEYPVYKRISIRGGSDNDRYKDIVVGHKKLQFPLTREVTKQICRGRKDNNCREYKEVENFEQTKKITLRMRDRRSSNRDDERYFDVFTKKYDIPYCK